MAATGIDHGLFSICISTASLIALETIAATMNSGNTQERPIHFGRRFVMNMVSRLSLTRPATIDPGSGADPTADATKVDGSGRFLVSQAGSAIRSNNVEAESTPRHVLVTGGSHPGYSRSSIQGEQVTTRPSSWPIATRAATCCTTSATRGRNLGDQRGDPSRWILENYSLRSVMIYDTHWSICCLLQSCRCLFILYCFLPRFI
jgi:hypothetical protein